ncbi:hypothetical protein [Paraburkholderia acidisoli]|uniref:LexA regulated protein n=1 Tax=Paraburkholderia acidisoli TaxID=2571748 RepID=A0A7Z2JGM9_9BURK|nr:hypothetical protein [Paraburkholderia acidisoli]QGZ62604.1 hypothetical protein FAZ98_13205 [Paraburkholderia acidisoli]
MAMKKTDLEKNKALKLMQATHKAGPDRFGKSSAAAPALDRREQRKLDQAQGLVPFACKLNAELVEKLKARAEGHEGGVNALVGELLETALAKAS